MRVIDASHYLLDISIDKKDLPNEYPFNLPVVRDINRLTFHPHVTFLVGENGSGKSTLLEAIAIAMGLNAEGGSKNFNFSTASTHSDLHEHIQITKGIKLPKDSFFLRAETFYNVSSEVDKLELGISRSYGGRSLHEQSHGESFISLVENRFTGNGLYILDEPEAALSPANQFKLLALMNKLVEKSSQFIIATHSPIIMGYPDADIYLLEEDSVKKVAYEDTPHYQHTKYFLTNRQGMLNELFSD